MKNRESDQVFVLYFDTISRCGSFLLNYPDNEVSYHIFEQFDIGVLSYLHTKSLDILKDEGLINDSIYDLSKELRAKYLALQEGPLWELQFVKTSKEWLEIMELSDAVRNAIHEQWTDEELQFLLSE